MVLRDQRSAGLTARAELALEKACLPSAWSGTGCPVRMTDNIHMILRLIAVGQCPQEGHNVVDFLVVQTQAGERSAPGCQGCQATGICRRMIMPGLMATIHSMGARSEMCSTMTAGRF